MPLENYIQKNDVVYTGVIAKCIFSILLEIIFYSKVVLLFRRLVYAVYIQQIMSNI